MTTGPNQLRSSRLQQLCRDSVLRPPHSNDPSGRLSKAYWFFMGLSLISHENGHPKLRHLTARADFDHKKVRLFSKSISKFWVTSSSHSDEETCDSGKTLDKGQSSILANTNEAKMSTKVAERSAQRQV